MPGAWRRWARSTGCTRSRPGRCRATSGCPTPTRPARRCSSPPQAAKSPAPSAGAALALLLTFRSQDWACGCLVACCSTRKGRIGLGLSHEEATAWQVLVLHSCKAADVSVLGATWVVSCLPAETWMRRRRRPCPRSRARALRPGRPRRRRHPHAQEHETHSCRV